MVTTAATPSSGGYTIGYDAADGIIKQKDSQGVVTPLFTSSSQTLRQTLALGNDSGAYSVMMGTGTSIYSSNSTNRIRLGYNGSILLHSVATSSGTSSIQISNTVIDTLSSSQSRFGRIQLSPVLYTSQVGSSTQSVVLNHSNNGFQLNHLNYDATAASVPVIDIGSTYDNDMVDNKAYIHINSKDSITAAGVKNSVIIGGSSLVASTNDTVYLSRLNVNNEYTLPIADGSTGQYMKTDGFGNVSWDNFTATTPSLSQVLLAGNDSYAYSIIMGTGTSIGSSNGPSRIYLDESGISGKVLISSDGATKAMAYVQLSSDVINIGATSGNITIGDKKGLQYSENYSATFVNNSLVTKQYVDAQVSSVFSVEKIAYVDPAKGSDVTGLINRVDKPFSSIAAATFGLTNSGTFTNTQPGLIYLKKGSYSANIYMQNFINYYCEPDVVVTGQGFTDLNGAVTCNIYGFARFIGAGNANLVPLDVTKASNINFQFLRIENQSVAIKVNNTSGISNVSISGDYISCKSSFGSTIIIGDNSSASSVESNVKINIKESILGGYNTINVKQLFKGRVDINCPIIECNSDLGQNGPQSGIQHAVMVQSASASVYIKGNLLESSTTYGGGNNSALYVNAGTVSVHGNVSGGKCTSVLIEDASSGSVSIKGDISSEREAIINTSGSIKLRVDDSYIKTLGLGNVAYPIHINSGSASSTYLNGVRIYNSVTNSSSILLSSTSSTIGIYNSLAYSPGTASGNFIYCASTASVGIHNTRSNKDNSANIVDAFSPSGFIYDQNLYLGDF